MILCFKVCRIFDPLMENVDLDISWGLLYCSSIQAEHSHTGSEDIPRSLTHYAVTEVIDNLLAGSKQNLSTRKKTPVNNPHSVRQTPYTWSQEVFPKLHVWKGLLPSYSGHYLFTWTKYLRNTYTPFIHNPIQNHFFPVTKFIDPTHFLKLESFLDVCTVMHFLSFTRFS